LIGSREAWRAGSLANVKNNTAVAMPASENTMKGKRQVCDTTISGPISERIMLPVKLPAI